MSDKKPTAPKPRAKRTPKPTAPKPQAAKLLRLRSTGTRRLVIGPPPRSAGGGPMIRFDTDADANVKPANRLGQIHTIKGSHAQHIRENSVVQAMAPKLGLQLG